MEIIAFGGGRRIKECERILNSLLTDISGRLILLPIPTTRDNIYVSGTDMPLSAIPSLLNEGDILVGYNIPRDIIKPGVVVYDGGEDEIFLLENALISARGALGYILTNYSRDVTDMMLGLVGYGRIGKALLRYLLALGADPTVYTRREEIAMELGGAGVRCSVLNNDRDLRGLDILINTSPTVQIDPGELDMKTKILDLASGTVFPPSERLTKLASIPDVYYPLSAGRLYAEGVLRRLDMEVKL